MKRKAVQLLSITLLLSGCGSGDDEGQGRNRQNEDFMSMPIEMALAEVSMAPVIAECVRRNAALNEWEYVREVTSLSCFKDGIGGDITNLVGIRIFKNVESLVFSNVPENGGRTMPDTWEVQGRKLHGLEELETLPKLREVSLTGLYLDTLDFALSCRYEFVDVGFNYVNFRLLLQCKNLRGLGIAGSRDITLRDLRELPDLEYLDISDTRMSNLYDLESFENLRELKMNSLQPLAGESHLHLGRDVRLPSALESITFRSTPLGSLHKLADMTNLKHLDLLGSGQLRVRWFGENPAIETLAGEFADPEFLPLLSSLESLTAYHLNDYRGVEGKTAALLRGLARLEHLVINGGTHRDYPFQTEVLVELQNLKHLEILNAEVNDYRLVGQIPSLQYFRSDFHGAWASACEQVEAIRAMNSELYIDIASNVRCE